MDTRFKLIRLSGFPSAYGGVDLLYGATRDALLQVGVDDLGEKVYQREDAATFVRRRQGNPFLVDLVKSVRARDPHIMRVWNVPPEVWQQAYDQGDMLDPLWDYSHNRGAKKNLKLNY